MHVEIDFEYHRGDGAILKAVRDTSSAVLLAGSAAETAGSRIDSAAARHLRREEGVGQREVVDTAPANQYSPWVWDSMAMMPVGAIAIGSRARPLPG